MPDPRRLPPDEFEILAIRELRKAGLELPVIKRARRHTLVERKEEEDDYALDIELVIRAGSGDRWTLVQCRRELRPVSADAIRTLRDSLPERKLRHVIVFSASGFDAEAVREAASSGIPLLGIADGKAAFARSGYATAAAAPSWVPEFMAEVVHADAAGLTRRHLIVSGQPHLILDRLVPVPERPPSGGNAP